MRYAEFKMERENLVHTGDLVKFTESQLPMSYYYTITPAVAMSRNYEPYERISSREGEVVDVRTTPRGFYVILKLDEDPIEGETEEDFRRMLKSDRTEEEAVREAEKEAAEEAAEEAQKEAAEEAAGEAGKEVAEKAVKEGSQEDRPDTEQEEKTGQQKADREAGT